MRLTQALTNKEMAEKNEQMAMREMHTLIVRLQDKAAQNQQLRQELEQKDRLLFELGQERNRLADEARVSRLSLHNLGDEDISGHLSGRAFQESSPARRRREKQEARRKAQEFGAPEIEMTKINANEYGALSQNEFAPTPYKVNNFEYLEPDLRQELGEQTVDGTFVMGQMTGEEYFETNPGDTSYEMGMDGTNRDLITEDAPVDMRSPDLTQIIEPEKGLPMLSTKLNALDGKLLKESSEKTDAVMAKVQAELSEYRVRCSKLKERVDHIERLNREHE